MRRLATGALTDSSSRRHASDTVSCHAYAILSWSRFFPASDLRFRVERWNGGSLEVDVSRNNYGRTSVAVFTDNDFDKVNGVTTTLKAVLRCADAVAPRIYTAADLSVSEPDYFAAGSLGVGLPWYREMRIYWPRLGVFARELRAAETEVIHITTPGPVGLAGRWLAAHLNLPIVGSYHTNLGDYVAAFSGSARAGRVMDRYMRWCYAPCRPILVPSAATAHLLVDRGYRLERLAIWGRGVDTDRFSPDRVSSTLRQKWHVDQRRPAILYAGRLSREKGLSIIEGVQQRLRRHGLDHRFIFVGDGPMRKELEERCPDAAFLGSVSHDRVAVAMASADLFLVPSATDTLGNVVLEAQASGLPVVVSDCGGPKEHMRPNSTGLVCVAGDVEAFAAAIVRLVTQRPVRTAMSAAAQQYAAARNWPASLAPLYGAWQHAADARAADPSCAHVGA
jgi:glycosyltransferase involved in cell wall biosynthesis